MKPHQLITYWREVAAQSERRAKEIDPSTVRSATIASMHRATAMAYRDNALELERALANNNARALN